MRSQPILVLFAVAAMSPSAVRCRLHFGSRISTPTFVFPRRSGLSCCLSMGDGDERPSTEPFLFTSWEGPRSLVGSLLDSTVKRSINTLSSSHNTDSTKKNESESASSFFGGDDYVVSPEEKDAPAPTIEKLLDVTKVRAVSVLGRVNTSDNSADENEPSCTASSSTTEGDPREHRDTRTYLTNPGVTLTALAHSLWTSVVLPNRDTVIDATCGNGKDCLALARILFPGSSHTDDSGSTAELIGIDIQSRAVRNTKRSLLSSLPLGMYTSRVSILRQSHEHLMDVPRDKSSIGLVCYNLGYLPGAPSSDLSGTLANYKECQTQTETTLHSITDASLLLRKGGLLSVMTYPASNLEESLVVEFFVEGLAMLTTRDEGGWRGYVSRIPDDVDDDRTRVRKLVTEALERVVSEGTKGQTWRAFVHRPLGRALSPQLVTATKIK